MEGTSPRLWPYAANNSPLPLPSRPVLYTPRAVIDLEFQGELQIEDELDVEGLRTYARQYASAEAGLDDLLSADGSEGISERRPILLQGELANPYKLQDIGMASMPLLPVRLEVFAGHGQTGLIHGMLILAFTMSHSPELRVGGNKP